MQTICMFVAAIFAFNVLFVVAMVVRPAGRRRG